MEGLTYKMLNIEIEEGDPTVIKWKGSSHSADPSSHINPFVDRLAKDLPKVQVIVDFSEVEFMDSSTVSPIVYLCKVFNAKGIKTTIQYNGNVHWQKSTFKALSTLSRVLEHVTVQTCQEATS